MMDPYLNFKEDNDKSNIQVNLFNVKGPLRNMNPKEKLKYLHINAYIFNKKEDKLTKDIELPIDTQYIDHKIYLSDSISLLIPCIYSNMLV